ncbi:MAG TPA: uroporphyrinogen decarboxylase family protein [Bacteroidales bacterium]|nr:uroporphyrinogen decarboxylase family protein [Bacteroidales bacterium]
MENYKLRNHIPISGPATREPFIGDESDLRVSLGFTPHWYNKRLGIEFSEKWHYDPGYRYETLLKMRTHLQDCFPMIPYFKINMQDGAERTCATISGVHGAMLISLIYGLEVVYTKDNWPSANPEKPLTKEQIEKLKPIDVSATPPMKQLIQQMDTIEKNWGQIHGYLNYQGVLNNAFRIRGNKIFTDMFEEPEFVHHLFRHIMETMLNTAKMVQERQRKSGFYINLLSNSNCVMNMLSPDLVEEFVMPYDIIMSKEFERFGIHTCNWNITPYIDALSKIEKIGYIDMGIESDMKKVKAVFPNARRAVMYSPVLLESKSVEDIRVNLQKIYDDIAPCDIVLADVENTTPDSKVIEFLALTEEILNCNKEKQP